MRPLPESHRPLTPGGLAAPAGRSTAAARRAHRFHLAPLGPPPGVNGFDRNSGAAVRAPWSLAPSPRRTLTGSSVRPVSHEGSARPPAPKGFAAPLIALPFAAPLAAQVPDRNVRFGLPGPAGGPERGAGTQGQEGGRHALICYQRSIFWKRLPIRKFQGGYSGQVGQTGWAVCRTALRRAPVRPEQPLKVRRRVGPPRAGHFGLRAQVEVTDARKKRGGTWGRMTH